MSSIIEQSTGIIVKSVHSGRTRYTAQSKQEVLAAFESSSLSAPAFASDMRHQVSHLRRMDRGSEAGRVQVCP